MNVFVTYITYPSRGFQFHVIVRSILETIAAVDEARPVDAVHRTFDGITVA